MEEFKKFILEEYSKLTNSVEKVKSNSELDDDDLEVLKPYLITFRERTRGDAE